MKKSILFLLLACSIYSYGATAATTQQVKRYAISETAILNRFLDYVAIESASFYPTADEYPMTDGQKAMGEQLAADAKKLHADVTFSEWGYVYVNIPSNVKKQVPTIGVVCHMDITSETPSKGIKPTVLKYEGGIINLGNGIIDPNTPQGADLNNLIGKTLIHTDGTTILGGDDKNGCAILMSIIETVQKKGFKHGPLQFVFCPNEDVGLAALKIDTTYFNPDILIDVDLDGGQKVAVSNFTAEGLKVRFVGNDVHPAAAKELHLADALAAVSTYIARMPLQYRPENTEGKQGYIQAYQLEQLSDKVSYSIETRIRYFDKKEGDEFNRILRENLQYVRESFPYVKVEIMNEGLQYANVEYTMHPQSIPLIKAAATRCQMELDFEDLRAGTTAAMLSTKGLPGGMSLFSGQHNEHSVYEYSVLEEMYDAYILLLTMIDEIQK